MSPKPHARELHKLELMLPGGERTMCGSNMV